MSFDLFQFLFNTHQIGAELAPAWLRVELVLAAKFMSCVEIKFHFVFYFLSFLSTPIWKIRNKRIWTTQKISYLLAFGFIVEFNFPPLRENDETHENLVET